VQVLDKADALPLLEAELRALPAGQRCFACALVAADDRTARCIAESSHGLVVLNRFGARERHLLVVARRHVEHIHELAWEVYADLQRLAYQATRMLHARDRPARIYTAVFGSGNPLPMSYPHLHVHVVPVMDSSERARSTRVFSWSDGVVLYDNDEAAALTAELRSLWSRDPS
jgi:diadenosine tetraphosphate (Ap4A) HIT family hydrolase